MDKTHTQIIIDEINSEWVSLAMREADLQKLVLDWFKLQPGYFAFRVYVGPIVRANGRFSPNPMAGFPDIFGFDPLNQPFSIELKSPKGVVGPKQTKWMIDLEAKGVYCIVSQSLDYIIKELSHLKNRHK